MWYIVDGIWYLKVSTMTTSIPYKGGPSSLYHLHTTVCTYITHIYNTNRKNISNAYVIHNSHIYNT